MLEVTRPSVKYDGRSYEIIREGLAEILQPQSDGEKTKDGSGKRPQSVFYNPIQQFNRDLSAIAIRVFSEDYNLSRGKTPASQPKPSFVKGKRKRDADNTQPPDSKRTKADAPDSPIAVEANMEVDAEFVQTRHEPTADAADAKGSDASNVHLNGTVPVDIPKGPKYESKQPFRILDALSATGLRAIRYSQEIENVTMVTANDLSESAINSIKLHIGHNKLTGRVFPLKGNAMTHMNHIASDISPLLPDGNRGRYHAVDLDPYGTAVPFLDGAVRCVVEGGLLCITCTDSGIFASAGYSEKTFSQYGGLPFVGPQSHEGGLRLVLHAIATCAARYGLAIEPLLSLSIDFYVRVFVRVRKSPMEVKFLGGKIIQVYNCDAGCGAWTVQPISRTQRLTNRNGGDVYKFSPNQGPTAHPTCEHCGRKTHLAGPMWGGPLHNPAFIQRMLDILPSLDKEIYGTTLRIEGMLLTARDETLLPESAVKAEADDEQVPIGIHEGAQLPIARLPPDMRDPHPFFIVPSTLAKVLHCQSPSHAYLRSAILSLGYRATRSHTKGGSIRTDAPWSVIWEIMREWTRQIAPIKEGSLAPGAAGSAILRNERSNRTLIKARNELRRMAETVNTAEQLKDSLQAMLWRLDHPEKQDLELASDSSKTNGDNAGKPEGSEEDVSQLKIVFDESAGREKEARRVVRYQANPTRNWGPQSKAKG